MAEPFVHSPRQVQVPSFKTRNGLLQPAFISSRPSTSQPSEVSFDSLPGGQRCGCRGCRGSGGLPDKDALSHPPLQPLLLPTNQLTSGEEEGEETERGGKKKKAVRDGGKTLNLWKTAAHLFFFQLCLTPGWHTLLFAAGLGEHRMLFPISKINKKN